MTTRLESRLREALAGSVLEDRVGLLLDPFVARRGGDAAAQALEGRRLLGLARALATSIEAARFAAHRPQLLERIAGAGPDALRERGTQLAGAAGAAPEDLEEGLDALRLLRRDETLFAAALWFGGLVEFDAVSDFLSELAESILAQTLARAQRSFAGLEPASSLAILGMGKVGGREFTYHSDLDLIFLCQGGVEGVVTASRLAQRLIAYLTTRTGAGVAYAVDSRLRPSGNQGLLVTTLDSFARYQREDAQTWEHLALMRARAIAGDVTNAAPTLAAVHEAIVGRRLAAWAEIADMRRKVEAQRADEKGGKIAFKTGAGGLMDVDFLAAGASLERGADAGRPAVPGNAALLRAAEPGPVTERLLVSYGWLRHVEGCARWVLGRAAETLEPEGESFRWIETLAAPAAPPGTLVGRLAHARREIRAIFDAVTSAGSIEALQSGGCNEQA